jgi:pyruvate/2-oxoglutarate dehydrogenase complex dihydrolipoamide acyltransferase (E2) component
MAAVSAFKRLSALSSWRRISLSAWDRPSDPTVYGWLEIELSNAKAYLRALNESQPTKVTMTHLVGKALADAIAARPEVNVVVRRGRQIYQRQSVDVFFQVAYEGGENLSGAKVSAADRKSMVEIADELEARVRAIREHASHALSRPDAFTGGVPALVRKPLLRAIEYAVYDLGLNLSAFGIPQDAFGSAMVTNVGMFGLPHGFAPLVPFSRAPIVITVGAMRPAPVVVDGEVAVREVLTLGVTLDHRVIDGYQAGKLAERFHAILTNPQRELG